MTSVWVVRAGRSGEHEQWNIEHSRATIGWRELGDLTACTSKDELWALVRATFPDFSPNKIGNNAGQLWAFRSLIAPGDLVVMPLKTRQGYFQFGRCTGGYGYDPGTDPGRRHYVRVEWQPDPVARTVLKPDLLAKVNAAMTVFSPSLNRAAARLELVAAGHQDPGIEAGGKPVVPTAAPVPDAVSAGEEVTDPAPAPTLEAIRDRIRVRLAQDFREHELTRLVADILTAMGFSCEVSPPGADGGIDIRAGRGPLGLDSLTIVEVKSEPGPVGVTVLSRLHSAMGRTGASQGLLVAMGGLNGPAKKEHENLRSSIQIWDSEKLLDHLFDTYPQLSEATRAALPLRQTWVLDDDTNG